VDLLFLLLISGMQSVLGGQTVDVIVISAPDFKLWTSHTYMYQENPFYHILLIKNPALGRVTVQLRKQIITSWRLSLLLPS
jgi:hypothetical protein